MIKKIFKINDKMMLKLPHARTLGHRDEYGAGVVGPGDRGVGVGVVSAGRRHPEAHRSHLRPVQHSHSTVTACRVWRPATSTVAAQSHSGHRHTAQSQHSHSTGTPIYLRRRRRPVPPRDPEPVPAAARGGRRCRTHSHNRQQDLPQHLAALGSAWAASPLLCWVAVLGRCHRWFCAI